MKKQVFKKMMVFLILFPKLCFCLSESHEQLIKELVAINPQQLSIKEYSLIAEVLTNKSPCNMLVFGVGRDSFLWMQINKGGRTIFLEDNLEWLQMIRKQFPSLEGYRVVYSTLRTQWSSLLAQPTHQNLMMDLPKKILEQSWDVIFIDGPTGFDDAQPGRMKSIYTGAFLAKQSKNGTAVFVHDCDRVVEAAYCDTFFNKADLQLTLDRLRFYLTK